MADSNNEDYRFDLMEHQKLCLNYLTRMVDPKLDNLPYWRLGFTSHPAFARHCRVDDAELVASWGEALIKVRQMLGCDEGKDVEASFKRHVMNSWGESGLRYHEPHPWSKTIFCNIHEMSYVLSVLATWYEQTGEKEVLARGKGLVQALRRIAVFRKEINFWSGDFPQPRNSAFFPYDNYYKGTGYEPTRWTGRGEEAIRNGMVIEPLVRWYDVAGDEAALDLAEGLINHLLYESRRINYKGEFFGHVHSMIWLTGGIVRLAVIKDDQALLEKGRAIFEYVKRQSSSFGWVPEYVGWHDPRDEYCETCCIKDMIETAHYLVKAGYREYLDLIDTYARNHLAESQIKNADFLEVDNSLPDTEEMTYRDLDKRAVGGFSGGSEPNSISLTRFRSIAGCCVGTAPQAFWRVWKTAVQTSGKNVLVELPVNIDHKMCSVKTGYPRQGTIELAVREDCNLMVRIPSWGGTAVALTVDDTPFPVVRRKDYILLENMKKGRKVGIEHAMPAKTTDEVICGMQYTIEWRGNTVMSITPPGAPLALYQRKDSAGNQRAAAALENKTNNLQAKNQQMVAKPTQ
jgi:hypothetical protein